MSFPISCDSCGASFRLPESLYEKRVKGRVATIRCKQCAAKINVDGTEFGPPVSDVADDADDYWAVSFTDDDDRALTTSELADALKRGDIDGATIVWRDELEAWTRIAEVAALRDLVPNGQEPAEPEQAGDDLQIDVDTSDDLTAKEEPATAETADDDEAGAGRQVEAPGLPAAKKTAPSDGVFDAPPESVLVDVDVDVEEEKPQRKGLVFGRKPPPPPRKEQPSVADDDGNADIDFLSLSAPLDAQASSSGDRPSPTNSFSLDEPASVGKWVLRPPSMDLMAAASPPSAAVPARPRDTSEVASAIAAPGAAGARPTRNWLAAGLILVGAAGLMLAVSQLSKSSGSDQPDAVQPAAVAGDAAAAGPTTAPSPTRSASPTAEDPKKKTPASATDTEKDKAKAAPAAPAQPAGGALAGTSNEKSETSTGAPPAGGTAPAKTTAATTPVAKTEKPAGAGAAPFDRGAAVAALRTAAGAASSCRRGSDPSGTATVTVTFANSGRAINANVSGPPFAGTATGGCIAAAMRRARVPPFSGDRVTVSKRVVIH